MNVLEFLNLYSNNDKTIFSLEKPKTSEQPNEIIFSGKKFEFTKEVCKMDFQCFTVVKNPENEDDVLIKMYITI